MALGSRLRMLSEKITADGAGIYALYQSQVQPKWFPVMYTLGRGARMTITEIAREIGHSHPSVSKIIAEMTAGGLISEERSAADGRKNSVMLSEAGLEAAGKMELQYQDVAAAVEEISAQASHDLWKAIQEWEFILEQKSLLQRVVAQQKKRESAKVTIIDYTPDYHEAFRSLNVEWISKYFKMEKSDYNALDDPDGYIISRGGHILVALYEGEPAGVCALVRMDDPEYDFEMAKMAVSPKVQGKSIGWLLGQSIVAKAASLGAGKIYLESNTQLKPAIHLYHKLGFQKIAGRATPYERCDIQMELVLTGRQ